MLILGLRASHAAFTTIARNIAHSNLATCRPIWAIFGEGFYDPTIGLIIPVVGGAVLGIVGAFTILAHLCARIVDDCLSLWARNPPANQVVIEAGRLRLEFGSSMQPVQWEFIAEFA